MREIDEVRIILSRLLSHTAQFPSALIDEMLKASQFVKRHMASIKVNAYGRGLLVRLRDLKLVTTRTVTSRRNYDFLTIRWDNDKLMERAEGDRALRLSRIALNTHPMAMWRGFYTNFYTYNQRVDDNWSTYHDDTYGVGPHPFSRTEGRRPRVWDRWITRRLKVQAHYNMRHRLGVKLLDFGEP